MTLKHPHPFANNWKDMARSVQAILGSAFWSGNDCGVLSTITPNAGKVASSSDYSGNGRALSQGTAANQPPYTNGVSIDFSATDDLLGLAASIGSTYDCYFVLTTLASNATWRSILYNQNGNYPMILESGSNRLGAYNGGFVDSGLTIAPSTKAVILLSMTASVPSFAVNNTTLSLASTTMPFPDPTHVCSPPYGFGLMHDMVMANENSTTAKRAAMMTLLKSKWGIA